MITVIRMAPVAPVANTGQAGARLVSAKPVQHEYAGNLDCVAAISVTHLATRRNFAGLDQLEPDARIGYSIYVYDLRRNTAR